MDNRVLESGASATPPAAPSTPSVGYPTKGNPSTGTPASKGGVFWHYQIGEELRAILVAAGVTPSAADLSQLLQALNILYAPTSMVRLNGGNGYGSTNTKIRRFLTVVTNQGSDITYTDSATLGASFTINKAGVYGISYSDNFSGIGDFGVSLNSTELTTVIQSVTAANRLCIGSTQAANYSDTSATALYLPAGSVIRAHTEGITDGGTPQRTQFTIARIG